MRAGSCFRIVLTLVLVLMVTSALGAGENPKQRPFWGRLAGEATFPASEACLGVTGAPFQTVSAAKGKMTHLGRTMASLTHCSTMDGGLALSGVAVFTAANGDEVWFEYTAETVAPPPIIAQEAEFIIVGGTGRFADASGFLHGMVYVTFQGFDDPSWPLKLVLAGTISY